MNQRKHPRPIEENGRYKCPIEGCDNDFAKNKGYAHKSGYRRHIRKEHNGDEALEIHEKKDELPDIPPEIEEKIIRIEEKENITGSKEEEMELEELYHTLQRFALQMERMDIVQDELNVSAEAEYIVIVGLSDLHMGKRGVDYEYIDRLLNFVSKYKRVFAYINGDLIDNWVNFAPKGGGHDEILPPKYQKKVAEYKISQIKDSLLWIIQGNHEYRSEKQGEESPLEQISKKFDIPYLGHGGRINLQINDIPYKLHCRHKFRYNSSFNPTHSCVRLNDVLDDVAEIVMIGHKHQAATTKQFKAGRWRSYIRYGAAYPSSNFEEYLGYSKTPLVAPSILMSGVRKFHEPFMELGVLEDYVKEES